MFDTVHLHGDPQARIGGPLWLLIFGLVAASLQMVQGLVTILTLISSDDWRLLTTPGTEVYHPLWQPTVAWELLMILVLFPYAVALAVFLGQRRRLFPRLAIGWFILGLIFAVVDQALVSRVPAAVEQGALASVTVHMVAGALGAIFWAPYLLYSARAKRTFVH
jgi:hypothetical protein